MIYAGGDLQKMSDFFTRFSHFPINVIKPISFQPKILTKTISTGGPVQSALPTPILYPLAIPIEQTLITRIQYSFIVDNLSLASNHTLLAKFCLPKKTTVVSANLSSTHSSTGLIMVKFKLQLQQAIKWNFIVDCYCNNLVCTASVAPKWK